MGRVQVKFINEDEELLQFELKEYRKMCEVYEATILNLKRRNEFLTRTIEMVQETVNQKFED